MNNQVHKKIVKDAKKSGGFLTGITNFFDTISELFDILLEYASKIIGGLLLLALLSGSTYFSLGIISTLLTATFNVVMGPWMILVALFTISGIMSGVLLIIKNHTEKTGIPRIPRKGKNNLPRFLWLQLLSFSIIITLTTYHAKSWIIAIIMTLFTLLLLIPVSDNWEN